MDCEQWTVGDVDHSTVNSDGLKPLNGTRKGTTRIGTVTDWSREWARIKRSTGKLILEKNMKYLIKSHRKLFSMTLLNLTKNDFPCKSLKNNKSSFVFVPGTLFCVSVKLLLVRR